MKKCAIVTGGASGIGRSVALSLATDGFSVVIGDTAEEKGNQVAQEIEGTFVHSDLSQGASCQALIAEAIKQYGSVDVLINNAGFQHVSPLEDFPEETWNQMISVMLTAPFLLTRYAWPSMKKAQWGRIINMASIHAMVASPNKVGYISAKHGMIGLTRTAALEGGAHNITVNALCPAYVRTPLVENQISAQAKTHELEEDEVIKTIMLEPAAIKRLIEPDEIASLVSYLCSDAAASITGACWTVDGGWTAR